MELDYAWDFDEYSYGCGERTGSRVQIWVRYPEASSNDDKSLKIG
jgi:hypothetical protein